MACTLFRGLGLRHCARRERMVHWSVTRCSGMGLRCSARRDQMVRCSAAMSCIGLGLRCCTRRYCMHCCCAKSALLASINPHLWLVHRQGHRPCPLHHPASPQGWARAHDVRAEALRGKISSLRTLGSPDFPSPNFGRTMVRCIAQPGSSPGVGKSPRRAR